jgi:hypothetical protein
MLAAYIQYRAIYEHISAPFNKGIFILLQLRQISYIGGHEDKPTPIRYCD